MMRRAMFVVLVNLLVVATAPAALAVGQWASAERPHYAKDGSARTAAGYGTFYRQGGDVGQSIQFRDVRDEGNAVFANVVYYFYKNVPPSGAQWDYAGERATPRTGSNSWVYSSKRRPLDAYASQVRGVFKICEDVSMAPDRCGGNDPQTFAY